MGGIKRFEDTVFGKTLLETGLSDDTVRRRVRAGWTEEQARTIPPKPGQRLNSLRSQARAAGMPFNTLCYRIHKKGWSVKRALATPVRPKRKP